MSLKPLSMSLRFDESKVKFGICRVVGTSEDMDHTVHLLL